jgi:hypothetical protein
VTARGELPLSIVGPHRGADHDHVTHLPTQLLTYLRSTAVVAMRVTAPELCYRSILHLWADDGLWLFGQEHPRAGDDVPVAKLEVFALALLML